MQKEELKMKIEQLPLFKLNDVAVKNEEDSAYYKQQNFLAVNEIGKNQAICIVGKGYNLVQHKEICLPIVEGIEGDLFGQLFSFEGKLIMDIFPEAEEYSKDGNKYGISVRNSVDLSSSLVIRFSVLHNGKYLTFPKSIAGFKRNHSKNNLLNLARNYGITIGKVQKQWETICTEFPKIKMVKENPTEDELSIKDVLKDEKLKFGKNLKETIFSKWYYKNLDGEIFTLWDFFNECINFVSNKNYKTEVHKRNNMDNLVQKIIEYAFMTKII